MRGGWFMDKNEQVACYSRLEGFRSFSIPIKPGGLTTALELVSVLLPPRIPLVTILGSDLTCPVVPVIRMVPQGSRQM
jgi:hypothetical protein